MSGAGQDYCEDADCPCVMHGEHAGNLRARVARLEEALRAAQLVISSLEHHLDTFDADAIHERMEAALAEKEKP